MPLDIASRRIVFSQNTVSGTFLFSLKTLVFAALLALAGTVASSESGLSESSSGVLTTTTAATAGENSDLELRGSELPVLGNTAPEDDQMSIEIADQFVWKPAKKTRSRSPGTPTDVWSKIIASDRMPVHIRPAIDPYKKKYVSEIWAIERILARATPYVHYIVERLDARGLPLDLALLPVVESGYQTDVKSEDEAAGLWQIIPGTAKQIGLKRTLWFDGRTDIKKSTRGALDYLSFLNAEFAGSWELTLAAYNAGPGRVRSAIERNREAGLATDFWSLKLPKETMAYVPKLIAILELLRQTPASPIELPKVPLEPYFAELDVKRRISLDIAAELGGISPRLLQRLNGGLIHGVTPAEGPHALLVPTASIDKLEKNLATHVRAGKRLFNLPRTHLVKNGDTLGGIALQYGLTLSELKDLNAIDSDFVRSGQKLTVIDKAVDRSKGKKTSSKTKNAKLNKTGKTVSYVIRPGDTLSEIAKKFNVPIRLIRLADGSPLNAKRLIPGKRLIMPAIDS